MSFKLRTLGQNIIVELDKLPTISKGGIFIPDITNKARHTGIIRHVSEGILMPDGKITPLTVKIGDKILFGRYAGMTIKMNGIEYKHMRENEIIGIIEEGEVDIEDDEE